MTDREIRLELAKAALGCGLSLDTARQYYDWVVTAPELEPVDSSSLLDNTPIELLASRTRIKGTVIKRCKDNGINTVGDLIRCGATRFSTFRLVGKTTIQKIDDALEKYYGFKDWYLT